MSRHFQKNSVFYFLTLFKFFHDRILLKVENTVFSYSKNQENSPPGFWNIRDWSKNYLKRPSVQKHFVHAQLHNPRARVQKKEWDSRRITRGKYRFRRGRMAASFSGTCFCTLVWRTIARSKHNSGRCQSNSEKTPAKHSCQFKWDWKQLFAIAQFCFVEPKTLSRGKVLQTLKSVEKGRIAVLLVHKRKGV